MEAKSEEVDTTQSARDDTVLETNISAPPLSEQIGCCSNNTSVSCVEARIFDDQNTISSMCFDNADEGNTNASLREDVIQSTAAPATVLEDKDIQENDNPTKYLQKPLDNPGHAAVGNDDDNENNGALNFKVENVHESIPPVKGLSIDEQEGQRENNVELTESVQGDERDLEISIEDAHSDHIMSETRSKDNISQNAASETIAPLLGTDSVTPELKNSLEMKNIISHRLNDYQENETVVRGSIADYSDTSADAKEAAHKMQDKYITQAASHYDTLLDNSPDVHEDEPDGAMTLLASQVTKEQPRNDDISLRSESDDTVHTNVENEMNVKKEKSSQIQEEHAETSGRKIGALEDATPKAAPSTSAILPVGSLVPGEGSKLKKRSDEKVELFPTTEENSRVTGDNIPIMTATGPGYEKVPSLFSTGILEATVHNSPAGERNVAVKVEVMESDNPKHEELSCVEEKSREKSDSASCDLIISPTEGVKETLVKTGLLAALTEGLDEYWVDGPPRADIVEKADGWLVEWVQSCGKKEKTLPLHLRLNRYRERVLTQKTVKASGFVVLKNTRRKKIQQLSHFWNNLTYTLALWGRSIRKVEGVHGAGVASYFLFLRWLFGFNIFLFIFMGGFIVIPMVVLEENELTASSDTTYNTSYYCSLNYTVVKGSGFSVVLELIQGSGWMEKTPLFYGYYAIGVKAAYNLPLAYVLTVIGCLAISLILMARYTGHSFREALLTSTSTNFEYSNKVFGAWDYSLTNHTAADLKMKGITYDIQSEMIEQAFMRKRIERLENRCSKCWLYFLRIVVNFFIILSLGGAAYLIYYVTSWSTEYASDHVDATGTESWLLLLVQYLPSLTITICNAVLPLIFEQVVLLEDYSQVFIIKITLVRTVFLRLASLIVLVITLYSEISCSPKDSCNANQEPDCTNLKCWETYVGQQFYKLVVMDFLVAVVKVLVVELPRRFFTSKCQNKLLEKIGPPEFNIPSNVLDLVYGECLVWLGFLFSPMLPGVVIIKCFIIFYVKLLSALVACPPTERPYKASRINTFFMVILLVAFFLCTLPVIYTIFGIPPSKGCGPFRVYDYMNIAIKNDVKTWPSVLSSSYDFLTSAAFTAAVIIILGVAVYYMRTNAKAHKQQAELYKEQLIMEGRDKQFLLSKFQEMYTPSKPDPKKPDKKYKKGHDQVALINEQHDPKKGSNPPQSFSPPNAPDDSGW